MIEVKDLKVDFIINNDYKLTVLDRINITIETGSIIAIVGPSGCGKTTFLNCIAGLINFSGEIKINNQDAIEVRNNHRISYVFQKPVFFEWKTIIGNLRFINKIINHNNDDIIEHYLNEYNLYKFKDSFPNELSGGMLARLALIRSLINKPEVLLLDEAFNFLDDILKEKINLDIYNYWLLNKPTIIIVTHNLFEAVSFADKIIVLSNKSGDIKSIIDINLPKPRSFDVANSIIFKDKVAEVRNVFLSMEEYKNEK